MSKCYDNPDYDDTSSDIQNTWNQFKPEKESFEDYIQRLKDRRTEDSYKYTDDDFKKYEKYIKDCCKSGMSVYKCLEFMYFAEKDMDDQLFNREPKQEIQPEQIWNEEKMEGVKKLIQKQKLIDMMEQDEQLGLYQETKCHCGLELDCKDCSQSLQDCTCIEDTIDMKQSTKDRILSETSEETKQRVRDTANRLVMKQETLEEAAERRFPSKMEMYDVFIEGAKWQQEQIGKSEFLQKLRATLSDAEARRLIFETFKKK
jgi:hypothetical protein